jgi:16S rRNA G966 N2-methylase RsmD
MIDGLSMPYMGSKRKLAPQIISYILHKNPKCRYVYDLFGGGGAISFYAMQCRQIKQVFYNELNTGVVELLRKIQRDGVTDEFYQWIDRDTFMKHRNDNDWFGGLCKVIWSFGNNQVSYLFGKDIEEYKNNYHLVVVNNINKTKEMTDYCEQYVYDKYKIKQKCDLIMPTDDNCFDRKLNIRKQLNKFESQCKLSQIRAIQQLQQLERLQQLQQLERLQQLEQLERLQPISKLSITNLSYEEIEITTPIDETIIYCDIPYFNTGTYQEKLCHESFNNWVKSSPYKIYISSYESDFNEVLSMTHRSTLNAINKNRVDEKLFCNRAEEPMQLSLF